MKWRISLKKIKQYKKIIIIITALILMLSSVPFIMANASAISVVEDGMPISKTNDYRIDSFPGSYKYKIRENWDLEVDGVNKGKMALFVPPGTNSTEGRTMAHKDTLYAWGAAFGGNPSYVKERMLSESTGVLRLNDGKTFERYYSVYIGKHSGAKVVAKSGFGGQGYLEVTTSSFPKVTKLQAPTEVNQNTDFNVTFSGIEYNPFTSNMSYKILVNGSPKASGTLSASDLGVYNNPSADGSFANKIEKIQIGGTGTYTIELALTDGIQRTSTKQTTVTVKEKPATGKPYLEIDPSVQQIKVGETTSYSANYYDKDGKKTDVTTNVNSTWSLGDSNIGQAQSTKGLFKGLKEGNTTVKVTYSGLSTTAQLIVANDPPPPEPEPSNEPPIVEISGPTEVISGEKFCLRANASDSDGTIESYMWDYDGIGSLSDSIGCELWYKYESDEAKLKKIRVTVVDDKGASATDDHYINVLPPKPSAAFEVSGTEKENRKVTITDKSSSPDMYPLTDNVTVLTGTDVKETIILYEPIYKESFMTVRVLVSIISKENIRTEFEYNSDIQGFDKAYAVSNGNAKMEYIFTNGNADSVDFFKEFNTKIDFKQNLFALTANSTYELVDYKSQIDGDTLFMRLTIQEK
jgi:hypothetical protein